MTHKEIELCRRQLSKLTSALDKDKGEKSTIKRKLQQLARKMGASTSFRWVHPNSSSLKEGEADSSELIRNTHQALQTASIVESCRVANSNSCLSVVMAAGAVISAVAAWAAVL